jgi:hypothetical protein
MLVLYVLLGVAIIVAVVIAVAALGVDRFARVWEAVPAPLRTILNVAVAAAITVGGGALVNYVTSLNLPPWLAAIAVPFVTALVRALNPGDGVLTSGYGFGASSSEGVDAGTTADPVS